MSRCFRVLALISVLTMTATAVADDPKKPETKLEGTWILVGLEKKGQKVSPEVIANATMAITGNDYLFNMQGQDEEKGTLKVDGSKKPATIDLDILTGEAKGKKQLGIYEIDDKTLKLCLNEPGDQTRPKEIHAKQGSEQTLFIFKKK